MMDDPILRLLTNYVFSSKLHKYIHKQVKDSTRLKDNSDKLGKRNGTNALSDLYFTLTCMYASST